MTESLALDSYEITDINKLLKYGNDLVTERKAEIDEAIHKVVDQVFGQEKGYKC
jgi:hypothetical protein